MDFGELSSSEEEGPKTEIPRKRRREAEIGSPSKRQKLQTGQPCTVLAKRSCEAKAAAPTSFDAVAVKSLADQSLPACDRAVVPGEPKIAARVELVETMCVCGIFLRTPKETSNVV